MTAQPVSDPPAPAGRHPGPRPTRPGQWVLLVVGTLLTALGLAALVSGLVLAAAASAQQGGRYLSSPPDRHQTIAYALVGPPAVLDLGEAEVSPVPFLNELGSVQVRVTAVDPGQELFVGVAASEDVDRYLDGVAHARMGAGTEAGTTPRTGSPASGRPAGPGTGPSGPTRTRVPAPGSSPWTCARAAGRWWS